MTPRPEPQKCQKRTTACSIRAMRAQILQTCARKRASARRDIRQLPSLRDIFATVLGSSVAAFSPVVVALPGTFDPSLNVSTFNRIHNGSDHTKTWLGYSCAPIGDFNGDGIEDIIVGAPGADSGVGRAYVLYGDVSGFDHDLDVHDVERRTGVGLLLTGTAGDTFSSNIGFALAGAGDVNGDSLEDVIIAAYGSSYTADGAAHVVYGTNSSAAFIASYLDLGSGSGGMLDGTDGFTLKGIKVTGDLYAEPSADTQDRQLTSQYTGTPVAGVGDVNGDGYDDIIIGSPASGVAAQGFAHLVFGGTNLRRYVDFKSDLSGEDIVVFEGAVTDEAGFAVAGGFDLNGDGLSDFMIGAPEGGTPGEADGEVYIVFGQEDLGEVDTIMLDSDLDGTNGFSIIGPSENARLGSALAGAGDVNGDGCDDIAIGAFGHEPNGRYRAGAAYVFFGCSEDGFDSSYDLKSEDVVDGTIAAALLGLGAEDALGIGVGAAGDFNADGVDDIWIGAPTAEAEAVGVAGVVYVVFGWKDDGDIAAWGTSVDLSALDGSNGFRLTGAAADGHLGWCGANLDVNQDGISDLLLGAFAASSAYVVLGEDGRAPDKSTATALAIVSGVLGCIVFTIYEAQVWLAKREAREKAARLAAADEESSTGRIKLDIGDRRRNPPLQEGPTRDINDGCEIIEPASPKVS